MSVFEPDPTAAVGYTEPKTEPKEEKESVYGKTETPPSLPRELTPWGQMIKELVETGCNDETYKDVWRLARLQVCSNCEYFKPGEPDADESMWDRSYLLYSEWERMKGFGWHGPIRQVCGKYGERAVLFGENKRKPIDLKHAKHVR